MASKKIDINKASVEDFEKVNGIGLRKAKAIIKYRKSFGGFSTVKDLSSVPGVGDCIVEQSRTQLTCSNRKRKAVRTPKVKDNVCKEQPSSSGLSARSIRHNQRALFKSTEEHVDDGNSIVSHEGHMSEEESGDEVMFREEDRSNAQHKSRIPIPVNGLFSSHVMKRKGHVVKEEPDSSPGKKFCRDGDYQSTFVNLQKSSRQNLIATQRMRIPSKEHPPDKLAEWLQIFQNWGNAERLMALDELITFCDPTQVRHMMQVIEPQFQRDFISLLPKEVCLKVLPFMCCLSWSQNLLPSYPGSIDADTSRGHCSWRNVARRKYDDNLVYGIHQLRQRPFSCPWKSLYMRQHQIELNWRTGEIPGPKLLKGHDDHVITCLEFCGTRIVSGSDDNTLKVWSAITGKCLRTLVGHTGGVWSSQMSNSVVISGSTDRTLKVWNADTGQCIHTLYGHSSTVRCMHLHKNVVVSGSRDATLRVWDIDSGACLHVLMGHVAAVRCVQCDGRRVVSGAYDYMVKVWDPETETFLDQWSGTEGQYPGSVIWDSTVKVWDITTGQCLQTLQGPNKHSSAVTCLQFNKKFVITSSDDGTVKIWDLKPVTSSVNLVALDSGGSGGVVWRVRCSNTKLVCAVGSRNGTEETKLHSN
ncbi:FBXW7 [Mytilus edulis]|uniref:FBXW7 n=1 Tax=Mytilus edulis TaxID=6550 RepID=A0A8S3UZQ8_MYTED|nr:FBXW7 [Mytilus edulis]